MPDREALWDGAKETRPIGEAARRQGKRLLVELHLHCCFSLIRRQFVVEVFLGYKFSLATH